MSSPSIPFPVIHSERPCLLCGSHDAFVIGTKGRDGSPLRTVISRQSGLVWTDPRPSTREIGAYYSQLYRLSYKGTWHPKANYIYRSGVFSVLMRCTQQLYVLAPGTWGPTVRQGLALCRRSPGVQAYTAPARVAETRLRPLSRRRCPPKNMPIPCRSDNA